MIMAAYCTGVTRERLRRQKSGYGYSEDVDDITLHTFMSGKKIDINNWENKRFYRKEEDSRIKW